MKQLLLFGAGKSATVLIQYLLEVSQLEGWRLTVVDADLALAEEKIGGHAHGRALSFDIRIEAEREAEIGSADLVISLLPPALHILVAQSCLRLNRSLFTASYVDAAMRALEPEVRQRGLLFLCELGLDPGLDHMSAMRLIDGIRQDGGRITSFLSHCGGLVAPESDDNPWHYKISWNPRNVVLAGKAGARYRQAGAEQYLAYADLFAERRHVELPGGEPLCWYPNRDSLTYIPLYGLDDCPTFIRTTLRHPDFITGWHNLVELQLTAETPSYESDGATLFTLFKQHLDAHGFSDWLQEKLHEQFSATRSILTELMNLSQLEETAAEKGLAPVEDFMVVNDSGDLQQIDIDDLKLNAASVLAGRMHDANMILKQLFYLGLADKETVVNRGRISPADLLQFALEQKLALQPGDCDRVVMLHEIEFEIAGAPYKAVSSLVMEGRDARQTAMATTVGLPLGVAARLFLKGELPVTGLHIPIRPEVYHPILQELERHEIRFTETIAPRT